MNSRLALLVFLIAIAIPCAAQDAKDVVAPGDNLVVKDIPPIPTSLAEDVDRYGADVDFYSANPGDPKTDRMLATSTGGGWEALAGVSQNGAPVGFLMANDEGPGFAKKKNNDFLFESAVMFMKTYLLN